MLGPGSVPVKVLNVTWRVGTYGPFTEQTNFQDLNNGALMDSLRAKARVLANLPAASQTT